MDAEEVVRTYADMVYKIAYRYVSNLTDAEDVFSETFLTYFKKERTFESEEHRKAWIIRVTINCAKELLGNRQYHEEINEEAAGAEAEALPQSDVLAVRQAIAQLPEKQREIICLFYLQDMTIKQIAEILDMKEGTVKVTLFRARSRLRELLEG